MIIDPTKILNGLTRFAFEKHGKNIAGIVHDWLSSDPPELIMPKTPKAPPKAAKARAEVDSKVDDMIAGRKRKTEK